MKNIMLKNLIFKKCNSTKYLDFKLGVEHEIHSPIYVLFSFQECVWRDEQHN